MDKSTNGVSVSLNECYLFIRCIYTSSHYRLLEVSPHRQCQSQEQAFNPLHVYRLQTLIAIVPFFLLSVLRGLEHGIFQYAWHKYKQKFWHTCYGIIGGFLCVCSFQTCLMLCTHSHDISSSCRWITTVAKALCSTVQNTCLHLTSPGTSLLHRGHTLSPFTLGSHLFALIHLSPITLNTNSICSNALKLFRSQGFD